MCRAEIRRQADGFAIRRERKNRNNKSKKLFLWLIYSFCINNKTSFMFWGAQVNWTSFLNNDIVFLRERYRRQKNVAFETIPQSTIV